MKSRSYLLFAGLMAGFLLLVNPVFAVFPNDTMPHFGSNSACSDHLIDPTPITTGSQTMHLCKRSSNAISWSFTIQRISPPQTVCTGAKTAVESDGTADFPCSITGNGSYKGMITYCISSTSCMDAHWDSKWTIP